MFIINIYYRYGLQVTTTVTVFQSEKKVCKLEKVRQPIITQKSSKHKKKLFCKQNN